MPAPDPIEQLLSGMRAAGSDQIDAYEDAVAGILRAWRHNIDKYDRTHLIQLGVKALMDDPNTDKENLAYRLIIAIDLLARAEAKLQ